jgi:hypothetical protein
MVLLIHQLEEKCWESYKSDLTLLSLTHREAKCERGVDKLYGLWALAPPCCQKAVPIDYSATLENILRNILLHSKKEHGFPGGSNSDSVPDEEVDQFKKGLFSMFEQPKSAVVLNEA